MEDGVFKKEEVFIISNTAKYPLNLAITCGHSDKTSF